MQTLVELLPDIERLGGHEAVRWSNGFRIWVASYAEFYGRIGAAVDYFDQRRIRKGDRVLIWAQNRMEWMAVFWACIARGIVAVPVDYRFSADLVSRIRIESRTMITIDAAVLDSIAMLPPNSRFTPGEVTP